MKNRWTQSWDDHFSGTSIFAAATTSFMRIGPQVSNHDLLNWTANIYCWAYKTWVETQDPSGRTSHSMEYDNGMPMVQVVETPLAIKSHHLGLAHGLDAYLLLSYTPIANCISNRLCAIAPKMFNLATKKIKINRIRALAGLWIWISNHILWSGSVAFMPVQTAYSKTTSF